MCVNEPVTYKEYYLLIPTHVFKPDPLHHVGSQQLLDCCALRCRTMKYLSTLTKSALSLKVLHFALATFALVTNALAEGFDTFGDQQRLENQVIIASGNIGKRTSVASYSNNMSYFDSQTQTVFDIGRFCFKAPDSYEDISGKAGVLLVDQFSSASVAVITESILSIKIKMTRVVVLDCASLAIQDGNRVQKQLQLQLDILKQQRATLDQLIKEQRAAAKKAP